MKNIHYNKNIPLRDKVDIFIAGGGSAGISAGVTAAREGLKVYLAESHTCFGGMATAGYVPLFMQFGDGVNFLADGFGREVYDAVKQAGGILYKDKYLSIPAEKLKRIYDTMAVDSGLDFTFQTAVVDSVVEDKSVKYAVCHSKNGTFAVEADVFIDCTGDGELSLHCGAEYSFGDENGNTMPGTLCSLWANIDWNRAEPPDKLNIAELLEKAFRDKIFTVEDRHHSGMAQTGKNLGSANIGHVFDLNAADADSLTRGFITGRKYLKEYEVFYNKYVKGYENAELAASGSLMGVRESRRIRGEYVLNIHDYISRRSFDDQIGCYCYEIDIHPGSAAKEEFEKFQNRFHTSRYQPGEHYGIPYRSLRAKGLENLLVAGRCISTDQKMQSSIRTMPGCFITGQAAGAAAAIAAKQNCRLSQININDLQNKLTDIGAFIAKK
ncbi:putative FAD-binding dehydrogenase [Limihaloglobus sulfuriphilus]|uniref:Putative FAD-binding dehydrogenase n=1 Tax=Limihaloglobus sulfuriphilus TaxID=1851148 RepID=A0A1Q2MGD6_9BACT|nr:FAD-dependent oxidoreductase [Limihaloglobus sulfuriphilus]AQQ71765.1 putative FAD-binding dehydrogenase [Limihaloglobus sulfuriphilus]